jgi:hypothetical protein
MGRLNLLLALSPLFACTGGTPTKDGLVADTDTATDADTDTDSDSDTDKDTDTDDTDTDHETGDTDVPPSGVDTGYYGPTRLIFVVDGATGSGTDPATVIVYDPATATSTPVSGLTVRGDALVDCAGDSLFVLEARSADGLDDRILRIDPETATSTEWALGNNFRPTDITAVGDGFWVANWGKSRLSTFDAAGAAGPFVQLADQADADGIPEANGLALDGPVMYVTLARQGQTDGSFNGARVIVVDTTTRAVTRSVDLVGRYPSGRMAAAAGSLHVGLQSTTASGGVVNADGGLERIALDSFATAGLESDDSATSVTETAAAFDPGSGTAWTATIDATGGAMVNAFSLLGGTAAQRWPVFNRVAGLGVADGTLWLAENPFTGEDGVVVQRSVEAGEEQARLPQDGHVRSLAVCMTGTPGSPPDTGGGAETGGAR